MFWLTADGSDLFVDDDVSGSETLEAPSGFSALCFLSSNELVAVVQSYLEQSWILYS